MREFNVYKIGRDGTYSKLVANYKTRQGAINRADKEAEDEWRSGVRYIVSSGTTSHFQKKTDIRADKIGLGDVEASGSRIHEAEA